MGEEDTQHNLGFCVIRAKIEGKDKVVNLPCDSKDEGENMFLGQLYMDGVMDVEILGSSFLKQDQLNAINRYTCND